MINRGSRCVQEDTESKMLSDMTWSRRSATPGGAFVLASEQTGGSAGRVGGNGGSWESYNYNQESAFGPVY